MLKEKFGKLNKKKWIILALVIASIIILLVAGKQTNKFNIKGIANRFVDYQYYDESSVFVIHAKFLNEKNEVLSPTVVRTQKADDLSYEIEIPQIDGYTSNVQELNGYFDEAGLEELKKLDFVKIVEKENIYNIYITISYTPIPGSYKIEYYEQKTSLDGYEKVEEKTVGFEDGSYTGEVVTGETVTISPEEKEGFNVNTDLTEFTGNVEANGAKTFKVYYDRNSYYFYTYNTGDTNNEPIEMRYGQNLDEVEDPIYSGYTFTGWKYFETLGGEEIEKPEVMPAHDLYAEAQWNAGTANYSLSFYTENANDTSYTNIGTYTVSEISGENLSQIDLDKVIQNGFANIMGDDAKYYHYNETKTKENNNDFDIEIEGSGVTIVPIYFDRNIYNIELDFDDSEYTTKAEIEINGSTYTSSYSFQAKYNQDITNLWLNAEQFTKFPTEDGTTWYFKCWVPSWSTTKYSSMRVTLTSDMINDTADGSTQSYRAEYTDKTDTRVLNYMIESLDQENKEVSSTRVLYNNKYYESAENYKQTLYSTINSWSAKELTGFTNVGKSNSGNEYYFYYDRNIYNIALYNMNNVYLEKQLKYGQSIEELANFELDSEDFTLETPGTKAWVFAGWYQDSNFMIPMTWTNADGSYKTVTEPFVLYANWVPPTYTVTFNTNGGTWIDNSSEYIKVDNDTYKVIVEEGDSLEKPQNPTMKGYTTQGWYYQVGDNSLEYLFSDSQKVYSDLNLTINFAANQNVSYKVRYIEAQYDDNDELIEDISKYTNIVDLISPKEVHQKVYGSTVVEYANDLNETATGTDYYVVNKNKQELVLVSENIEDNVIYFIYSKNPELDYTIYHVKYREDANKNAIKYEKGEVPTESNILKTETGKISALTIKGYAEEFEGWSIIGEEEQELDLVLNEKLNTMYFYYNENEKGEYVVNFYFAEEDGTYPTDPTYVYEAEASAGTVVYAKNFENFTWKNGATEDDYVGKVFDEDRCGNTYLIVTTTDETSAMNIYFKQRSDLSYIVKYLDENGMSLLEDKVVNKQIYLSSITETAPDIDGYKLIVGEEAEKTITIGLTGNVITFNYEKESNLSYSVRYIEKDTEVELLETKLQGGKVFKEDVTEIAPDIDGYRALETEKTITIGTGLNEIIFEYEKRNDLTYRVEYYYNDVIDNSYTENFTNQIFNTEITEYTDKIKEGYKLEKVETLPMFIGTGDNVIKVYYVSDPDQTKQLQYIVEYYKDGNYIENDVHTELVQLLEPDVLKVQKDRINVNNRYEGYNLQATDPEVLPDTIAADGTIKAYYTIKTDLTCKIRYIDADTKTTIKTAETQEGLTYNTEFTKAAPSIEGYNAVETEKTITVADGENEIVFEYTKRNDLSYTIRYLDQETNEEIKTADVIENQTFKSKVTETAPDIKGFFKTNLEETITIKVEGNEIIFYYDRIEGLAYTVNYYIKGTEEKLAETKIVYENAFGDKITETAIDIDGYYKEEPSTQEITIDLEEEQNVINFYYTIRNDLKYSVEYYFNNELRETTTFEGLIFKTEINGYEDKVEYGYKLGKTENYPLTIGSDESKNVIKVYYVIDESQRKDLTYTIEYYKDGTLAEKEDVEESVQVLQPDTLKVDTSKINTKDKYLGYYFIKTEPEEIPEEIMTESVIRIYYEIRKDLSYTIKCVDAVTGNTLKEEVITDQTYNSEITEIAPKIEGFVSLNEQETITIGLETNEIIFEYTDRTDLTYKVQYYFNNELREEVKFEGLIFRTVINGYEDKLEKGYKLEKTENFPLTIGIDEEANLIKVHYVTDPDQKKTLEYNVEYYKDGTLAKTEPVRKTVQWLEPDTMAVDKEKIAIEVLENKFDGYYYVNTEPEVIPDVVTTGDVIKVNYTIRKDLSYTVKYINIETNEVLFPEETVTDQTFNTKVTREAPEVEGLAPKKSKITITIKTDESKNEIVFEYETARNLPYTVNYYEDGTTRKVTESKTVWGNTYNDIVEETAIDVDGYNKVEPTVQSIQVKMKDNIINFYYTKRTDLKYRVEHYVDGVIQEEKTDYFENQTFKTKISKFTDKSDYGYKVGSTENLPLVISTDEEANVIKVHYIIDEDQRKDLKYTVEYYKDGTLADKEEFKDNVQVLQPDTMNVDKEKINTADRFVGYYFVNTEPDVIPDVVTTGDVIKVNYTIRKDLEYKIKFIDAVTGLELRDPEVVKNQTYNEKVVVEPPVVDGYVAIEEAKEIVINVETVEVSFEYTNRTDLTYKVEYYFNNVIAEEKTDTFENLVFKTKINAFTDKVEKGYMFEKHENLPLTIGIDEEQNVIKVYYVTDPSQTKELQYTVEYYKDGALAKTEYERKTVQWLQPDTMDVVKENINTTDKFDGYYFVNTEPEVIPDVVTNGDVIKVNYTIRKDLSYTVKYINIETNEVLLPEEKYENQTFNTKVTHEAPEIEGLSPKKAKITLTIRTGVNEIVFEYETARNLPYTVNYYEDGTTRKAADSKTVAGNTYNDIVEETAIDIDGYNKVEPTTKSIQIKMKDNVINFYYTKRTDLKYRVEHYVDGVLQEEKTDYYENQTFKTKITKHNDKSEYGYKVGSTENLPLEISTNEEANVIKVHYIIDENQRKDLKYTVEYYKDKTLADKEEFTKNVQVLEPETLEVDKTAINVTDKYVGYYFDLTEPETIPDVVTNGDVIKVNYTIRKDLEYKIKFIDAVTGLELREPEIVGGQTYQETVLVEPPAIDGYTPLEHAKEIVIGLENNEVSFEYTNRVDLKYKVEYYFNNELNEEKTDVFEGLAYKTEINAFTDKVEPGYMHEKTENLPLIIGIDEDKNVIKVYYVTDPNQKKTLEYNVEYYKDEKLAKTEPVTKTVQWLEPDTMEVQKDKINTVDKFDGYYFVNTEPEVIPDVVTNGDVIKVNYTIRNDLSYTVKCIDTETKQELKSEEIVGNQTYNKKVTVEAPEIDGYLPKKSSMTITITTGTNEIVFEYEIAQNLSYTVNYYEEGSTNKVAESKTIERKTFGDIVEETAIDVDGYNKVEPSKQSLTIQMKDNVINFYYTKRTDLKYTVEHYVDEKLKETETFENQTFKTKITEYNDKSGLGYKVGNVENLPLEISTNEETNVIKVYYVIDENQRKDLKYTVEYYKDKTLADKEEFTKNVQVLEPETLEVDKTAINVTDKYEGYYFVNTEPEVIPDEVANGTVIKVNYAIRKDLAYKINIIDAVTGLELREPEVVSNQTYGENVVVSAPKVDGYIPLEETKEIIIGLKTVEVTFEYTTRNDLSYKVEYYFDGVLAEGKTEKFENQVYKTKITEYADKLEKGYKLEKTENLPLTISVDESQNIIKVYYVTDEAQRKELKYTVEYYKDGTLADKDDVTKDVQVLEPETMVVDKEKINTVNKYVGYYFVNTNPEVIPDVVTNGDVIKVNYTVRKDLIYTVKYVEKDTGLELKDSETVNNQTYNEKITLKAPEIEGYTALEKEKQLVISVENNEIIFEYKTRSDLSYKVEYYYNDDLKEEETEKIENQVYKATITVYTDKVAAGYKLGKTENFPLTIGVKEEENVIKVHYVIDEEQRKDLKYTIEYYKDGILADKEEVTENVQLLEPETMVVDKEKFEQEKLESKYPGYYFENTDPEVIPDEVTNGDVIKVNYVIRKDLKYKVEYYFDGKLKEEKTEIIENQTYNQKITEYADKVEVGYKLEKTENLPLTIGVDETQNVIKVYYVTDPNQTKEIIYTVEYYKDGELADKEEVRQEVQVLAPDIVSLDKSKVNTEKEYEGYYFLNTEPEVIPDTVTNGDVIKVNYTVRKDLSYIVKYIDQVTKEELKPSEKRLNQTYNSEVSEIAPMIEGFTPVESEKTIRIGLETNEIVFEYTTRNDLSYKVEYYFNNEISEEKTDVFENQRYNTKITEYTDKVERGYKLEKVDNLPLTIKQDESQNVIKVFYITDETQTKVLKYTVEYYKNGTLTETEEETKEVQVLQPEIIGVNKEKINTKDKYEGYNFLKTEPEEIPTEVVNGDVIKVYYMPKAEYSYTIKYIDAETGVELKEQEVKGNQVFDSEVTEVAPEIPGYIAKENEKTIKITSGINEIIFEYEMKTKIEYSVEYYYDNVLNEELTETHTGKYKEIIEEYEDKVLVGYKFEKTENLPLTISDNPEQNIIKVYYQIDETQQKDLSYTVKYFKLDEEVTEDNQLINKLVQAAKPDELEVDKSQINVEDKYFGYKVSQIKVNDEVVEGLPDKVKNGDIIQIIYVIDENARKELQYNVEYYKDGVKADIEEYKASVQVLEPDTLNVDKTKINATDKYIGYKFEKFDTETIPDVVNNGDTIKVYYVRQDYEYKVEYYYDGILREENTDIKTAKYQDIIDAYEDKMIAGYILEDVKNLPLTISEEKEKNVIKVYYAKETFRYTINYYYEGIKDEENTVNSRARFGEVINEYPNKEKAGYELDRVENLPLSITEDMNKNIINVYYKLKDSQIEVRYVDKYTKEEILEREIINGKVFGDYDLSQNQKEILGYTLVGGPQDLDVKFEEDTVIYIFSYAKNSEVVVKYLEKDETPENEDNKVLAEQEVISGYENQEYETIQKEIENYSFVEVVGNKLGTFARENIEVIYFYAQNTKVVVNHIDKVTGETMETVEYTGKVGDSYQAEVKNFENYVLAEKPENESGIMTKEVITVNYYYNHVSSGVIEKHIDLMSNEVLENILHEGVEGTEYLTKEKEFEGYEIATNIRYYSKYILDNPEILEENEVSTVEELLEKLKLEKDGKYIPENAEGKMSIDALEVNYYYLRKTTVKVEYIDKATKETIKVNEEDSTVIINGFEGDLYKTELKEFDGYEIAKDQDGNPIHPGNAEGKMQVTIDDSGNVKTETNVRYYYEKLGKVVEQHIYIVTGKVIEEQTHYGPVGKEYKIENKALEGFEIVTNRRYYEKLVKDNPNILEENDVTTVDELLDKLQINSKNNYIPENAEGKMTEEGEVVKYYYIRKIKVVVRYVDKDTGNTIQTRYLENGLIQEKDPTVIFEGYEGDSYTATVKEFEYYILDEENYPTNEKGTMAPTTKEDGTIENTMYVTYYYVRKTANIKVEYVDATTGEVIKVSDNYTNNEGEEYKVEPKQIEGYDVIIERIPSNASGTLYEEGVTVRYYYIKQTKVIVRYVDVKTNETIEQETIINGHEGDSYTTQEKVINGYSLNSIAGKTTGNMTREDIIVTYYYDKKEVPKQEEPSNPNDSEQNNEQNNEQNEEQSNTNKEESQTTITPSVTIKPSEDKVDNEVIKTGDVGPNIYISIITFIIIANIIQIAFTNKKTKVIK